MPEKSLFETPDLLLKRLGRGYSDKAIESINNGSGKRLAMSLNIFVTLKALNPAYKTLEVCWKSTEEKKHVVFRLTARQLKNGQVKINTTSKITNIGSLEAALMATIWEALIDVYNYPDKIRKAEATLDDAIREGGVLFTKYSPSSR